MLNAESNGFWEKRSVKITGMVCGSLCTLSGIAVAVLKIYPESAPLVRGAFPMIAVGLVVGGIYLIIGGQWSRIRQWPCFWKSLSLAIPILIVVLWLGWPWPRIQQWSGGAATHVAEEVKIPSCGGSASALGGRLSISWVPCDDRDVYILVRELTSLEEITWEQMFQNTVTQFRLGDDVITIMVADWPGNHDDTLALRITSFPSSYTRGKELLTRECLWYAVTFKELEVRNLPHPPSDSIGLRFYVSGAVETLFVAIDAVGIYPLSLEFPSVASMRGDIDVYVHGFYPPSGYTWPDHRKAWARNDAATEGLHEQEVGNDFIIYTLRYTIECVE